MRAHSTFSSARRHCSGQRSVKAPMTRRPYNPSESPPSRWLALLTASGSSGSELKHKATILLTWSRDYSSSPAGNSGSIARSFRLFSSRARSSSCLSMLPGSTAGAPIPLREFGIRLASWGGAEPIMNNLMVDHMSPEWAGLLEVVHRLAERLGEAPGQCVLQHIYRVLAHVAVHHGAPSDPRPSAGTTRCHHRAIFNPRYRHSKPLFTQAGDNRLPGCTVRKLWAHIER